MDSLVGTALHIRIGPRILLDGAGISVASGELVAVMGPSGSGKTTLLNSLAGISLPAQGSISVGGREISNLGSGDRAAFRLRHIGMIFQFGELLPELTVLENVSLLLRLQRIRKAEADRWVRELLDTLGLGDRLSAFPDELSGGERQRVAIARALSTDPTVILADEPTGALDETNALTLVDVLRDRSRSSGAGVLIATHDPLIAERVDRVLRFGDGRLVETPDPAFVVVGERRRA